MINETMTEYVSIKEFAKALGISTQAVYKRLNDDLKPYATELNGEKRISIAAFKFFQKNEFATDLTTKLSTKIDEVGKQNDELIVILKQELKQVRVENEDLRHEVRFLREQLKIERQHSRNLSDNLVTIADQAQRLQLAQIDARVKEKEQIVQETSVDELSNKTFFQRLFGR